MGQQLSSDEIKFLVWSTDLRRDISVVRTGRLYGVDGVKVAFFKISVMAEAIGRDAKTIKRWQAAKLWPKPQWKIPDGQCTHWYSAAQIMGIYAKHREMSGGSWGYAHSRHFPLNQFLAWVRENFRKLDIRSLVKKEGVNGKDSGRAA